MNGTLWEHVPVELVVGTVTLVAVVIGGLFAVVRRFAEADRAKVAQEMTQQWVKIEELRDELAWAKVELAQLKERIRNLPDANDLHEKLDALEQKLERKIEALGTKLERVMERATAKFRCLQTGGTECAGGDE